MNEYRGNFLELLKLIHSWNLIHVTNRNEFDVFTEKILTSLYEGQGETKIERIVESELCVRYGLFSSEFNAKKLANEVMTWWDK